MPCSTLDQVERLFASVHNFGSQKAILMLALLILIRHYCLTNDSQTTTNFPFCWFKLFCALLIFPGEFMIARGNSCINIYEDFLDCELSGVSLLWARFLGFIGVRANVSVKLFLANLNKHRNRVVSCIKAKNHFAKEIRLKFIIDKKLSETLNSCNKH